MATQNRDVQLSVSVTTANAESIAKLEQEVRALAKQGGDAAPEFQRLADEVARLGAQAAALNNIASIGDDIRQLGAAETEAAGKAEALSNELAGLIATTESFRQAESKAKDELRQAQRLLGEKRDALATLKNETDNTERSTAVYQQSVRSLNRDVIAGRTNVRELSASYRDAREETQGAAKAENEFARGVRAAQAEVAGITRKIDDQNRALAESKAALETAGQASGDLLAAQGALVAASERASQAVRDQQQAIVETAAAAKRAAQEEERLASLQASTRKSLADQARAEADGVLRDFARMERAEREAAASARAAGEAIRNAFGTVGVRATKEIQAEIAQVRQAMDLLKTSGAITGRELDQAFALGQSKIAGLEQQLRAARGELTLMDRAGMALKTTFGQFAAGFTLVEAVQRLGRAFFDANKQIDAQRLALGTLYGSAEIAEKQIDFLRKTANRAGLSISAINADFTTFSASLKSANIPLEQTNALFAAVTQAAGTLGLSGEKVSHMLLALGQMASKGVVAMEELRRQLGDSLPGALSLVAKGLGITDGELIKLVESGTLLSRDLFPALTKSLQSIGGEVHTMNSGWERLKNLMTESLQAMGDSGAVDALKAALMGLGMVLGPILIGINTAFETVFTTVRSIGALVAAIVNRDFKMLGSEVKRLTDESVARQVKLIELYKGYIGASDGASAAQGRLADASSRTGAAQAASAASAQRNASAVGAVATAARTAAEAQNALTAATAASAQQVSLAGKNWQELGLYYANVTKTSEAAVLVADKLAKAKEVEGRASVELTKLLGGEREQLDAGVKAAGENIAAVQALSNARNDELVKIIAVRDALVAEAERLGDNDTSRQKQIQTISLSIAAKQAEAERTNQELDTLKNTSVQLAATRQAYEDNSAAINALRQAREAAFNALEKTQALEQAGLATAAQVNDAKRLVASAEQLYRDAIGDVNKALDRQVSLQQAKSAVDVAGLNLQKAQAKNSEDLFRRMGDETTARQFLIAQKEIDIRITQAKLKVDVAQADADIQKARNDEAEIKRRGDMTAGLQSEIDNRIALAEAKKLEAQATGQGVELLQREIDALRSGSAAWGNSTSGISGNTAARGVNSDATERHIGLLEREAAANTKLADSYKGTFTSTTANGDLGRLREKMSSRELSGDDLGSAQAALKQAQNNQKWINAMLANSPGTISQAAITSSRGDVADAEHLLSIIRGMSQVAASQDASATRSGGGAAGAASGTSHTVNINLGGKSSAVNVASQADADALVAMLRQLDSASGRAA